jgi:NADPH:quinone reductase-like Zn-dependent oxidoreductase
VTAWQLVINVVKAQTAQSILIHGAAGSVGSLAVQIAKWKGADVFANAAAEDAEYLRKIGARHVIDYKTQRFDEIVRVVDAVIDLVGGDTLERSYNLVKKGGVLVSTVGSVDKERASTAGIRAESFIMKANAKDLSELARLVHDGVLKPRVSEVLPLTEVKQAHNKNQRGEAHGKIILQVLH